MEQVEKQIEDQRQSNQKVMTNCTFNNDEQPIWYSDLQVRNSRVIGSTFDIEKVDGAQVIKLMAKLLEMPGHPSFTNQLKLALRKILRYQVRWGLLEEGLPQDMLLMVPCSLYDDRKWSSLFLSQEKRGK